MRFSGYEVSDNIINNRDFLFIGALRARTSVRIENPNQKMVLENLNINARVAQLVVQLICNQ